MDSRGATPSTLGKFLGCFRLFSEPQFLIDPVLVRCERARQYFLCIRALPFCQVAFSFSTKVAVGTRRRFHGAASIEVTYLMLCYPPPNLTPTRVEEC